MFSDHLRDVVRSAEDIGKTQPIPPRGLLALLEKSVHPEGLSAEEVIEVLNATRDGRNQELIKDFAAQYRRPHDRDILLLPPLYFSSICENRCAYCDFSVDGLRLSIEEFAKEFDALLALGYRSIELVSSQDPKLYIPSPDSTLDVQRFSSAGAVRYFEVARERLSSNGGGMLTSNIPPLDVDSFKGLRAAGLDCYLVWLETFNPRQYERLHYAGSPKINQAFRLDSFERAVAAGITHQAGAFLKGLYDWRREEAALYLLDRHLKKRNGHGFSIIGTPRLKGGFLRSPLVEPYQVSDDDYELNIALDRILFDGILWFQTREPFSLNSRLISRYGGGVVLTLTCSTAPGGYSKPSPARAQFPIHRQNLAESISTLENEGFRIVFSWTSETLLSFQRGSTNSPEA
jgi:2-iminoacetate synthase